MRYRSKIYVHLAVFAVVATTWATDRMIVDDWRSYAPGMRGVPGTWKEQSWGKPVYDLEIVSDSGQPVLQLRSKGESSTISRDLKGSVDLNETPILEWSWKVNTLPAGGTPAARRRTTRPPRFM